jgi:hypothetical protein
MDDEVKQQILDLALLGGTILATIFAGLLTQLTRHANAWLKSKLKEGELAQYEGFARETLNGLVPSTFNRPSSRKHTELAKHLADQLNRRRPDLQSLRGDEALEQLLDEAVARVLKKQASAENEASSENDDEEDEDVR